MSKHIGWLLLGIFFLIALFTFKQYGISWDESNSRSIASINGTYIFKGDNQLLTFKDREFGTVFDLPLLMVEKAIGMQDSQQIYWFRHLMIHSFFLVSIFFGFKLIDFLYNDKLLASIGFLLFIFCPLIYSHSFFNSRDIPFMSMFLVCFYLFAKAFHKKTILSFLFLGVGIGVLTAMRIMGILLFSAVIFFLFIDLIWNRNNREEVLKYLKLGSVFLLGTIIFTILCWPFLWNDPVGNFLLALKNMSKFRWGQHVLFNGESVVATELNWDYIPVWFGITNPIGNLILGIFGGLLLLIQFIKAPMSFITNEKIRNNLLYGGCFVAPIIAIIFLNSVVYDTWRHVYFIYPSFVMLAIYGLYFLLHTRYKNFVLVLTFLNFANVAYVMIKHFPNQHVYFNQLVNTDKPEYLRNQFELDYWGVGYKQSLDYLVANDDSTTINVFFDNYPGIANINLLKATDRQRIIPVFDKENADYFITNYRWHPQDYSEYEGMEWHSIKVGNNTINTIFKLEK